MTSRDFTGSGKFWIMLQIQNFKNKPQQSCRGTVQDHGRAWDSFSENKEIVKRSTNERLKIWKVPLCVIRSLCLRIRSLKHCQQNYFPNMYCERTDAKKCQLLGKLQYFQWGTWDSVDSQVQLKHRSKGAGQVRCFEIRMQTGDTCASEKFRLHSTKPPVLVLAWYFIERPSNFKQKKLET